MKRSCGHSRLFDSRIDPEEPPTKLRWQPEADRYLFLACSWGKVGDVVG